MPNFGGRVALITGGASGIGRASALEMARWGARLALTDVNEAGLQETAQLCRDQGLKEDQVFTVVGDLFIEHDIELIVQKTLQHYERVDILLNNAGRSEKEDGPVECVPSEAIDNCFHLLFKAPVLLTQKLVPTLRENKGNVINISSVFGVFPQYRNTAYSCMKSALIAFTKASAQELAPEVRVNSISPGFVDTGLFETRYTDPANLQAVKKACRNFTPLGRLAQAEEIAKAVVYLAADDAAFITGHNLQVDGGVSGRGCIPK